MRRMQFDIYRMGHSHTMLLLLLLLLLQRRRPGSPAYYLKGPPLIVHFYLKCNQYKTVFKSMGEVLRPDILEEVMQDSVAKYEILKASIQHGTEIEPGTQKFSSPACYLSLIHI